MLDDSSFAIRPDKKTDDDTVYFDIGRAEKIVRSKNGISIDTTSGQLRILFYCEGLIRFVFQPFGEASLATTAAVITEAKAVDVQFKEEEKQMTLASQELQVEINKEPVRITITDSNGEILLKEGNKGMGTRNREEVICYKEMAADDHFYGFGEKAGYLNKKGDKLIMWNTDVYAPHNPETDPLYQSIPFFLTLNNGRAYGIYFDNSFKTTFDLKSERDCYSFSAEGGALDYYFIAGPDPKDVLRRYSLLTGRMPLPPKWALGYHQSRYSYQTEEEVRELAAGFKERKYPGRCDLF